MRRDLVVLGAALPPVAVACAAAWIALGRPSTGVDDADIFLTYARHLAAGEGLVFHAGGERVEGFSSLAWVLLCAAALRLFEAPELPLRGLSVLLAAAAAAAPAAFAWRNLGSRRAAGLALTWSLAPPAFAVWTGVTLMDTALYAAVFGLGSVCVARAVMRPATRREWAPAVAVTAALLTRPEGLAAGLAWLLALAVGTRLAGGAWAGALRRCAAPAAAYAATALGLLAFRLAYFGDPLPNTYYAKVSPDPLVNLAQGLAYAARFAVAQPLAIPAALAAGLGVLLPLRRLRPTARAGPAPRAAGRLAISLSALAGLAIPVLEGGDHFALQRSFQPLWPILCLPLLFPLAPRLAHLGRPLAVGVLVAALAAMTLLTRPPWWQLSGVTRLRNEFALAAAGRGVADALNRLQPDAPRISIGVAVSGGFGYAYRGPVVDLLGLNNRAMGHSPGDRRGLRNHAAFHADTFWQLAPDLVFPDGALGLDPRPLALALQPRSFENRVTRGLVSSERFLKRYRPVSIGTGDPRRPGVLRVVGWARPETIARLRRGGLSVRVFSLEELREADLSGIAGARGAPAAAGRGRTAPGSRARGPRRRRCCWRAGGCRRSRCRRRSSPRGP